MNSIPGVDVNALQGFGSTFEEQNEVKAAPLPVVGDVEFTDPRESAAWGGGLSLAGTAVRKLASKGMLGRAGQALVKAPIPGLPGALTKAAGAAMIAIPAFAAADIPMSKIRQSEFAKENPITGAAAEIGAGLLAGAGSDKLVRPVMQSLVAPAAKVLGPPVRSILKGVNSLIDDPIATAAKDVFGGIWETAVTGPVMATGKYFTDPTASMLENVNLPGRLKTIMQSSTTPFQKTGKFFRDKLEPAIERLEGRTAERIRKARTNETLLASVGEQAGKDIAGMSLTGKLDYLRMLRGEKTTGMSSAAVSAIKNEEKLISDMKLNPRMVSDFESKRGKLYTSLLTAPEHVLTDPNTRTLLHSIEQSVDPNKWFRQAHIRMAIRNSIASPSTTPEQATLLKELFQLPATTPEVSLKAARSASKAYLERSLLSLKGPDAMVSVRPKPGYVKSAWGGENFKGLWVHPDLEMELQAVNKIERYSHGVFNRIFTTPWKTMKIIMSPAAQIRNVFTNFILNDIGGLPVYRMDVYTDALKGMRKNSPEWKEFIRQTGGGGTFSRNELGKLEESWKYDSKWYDVPGKVIENVSQLPKQFYNANEQVFKFAKYLHNLEKGLGKSEAALDAIKPTFNYGEITPAISALRSHAMPFATWTSKVIPYTFEMAVKHPIRVGKWFMFYEGLQQLALQNSGLSEAEWQRYKDKFPQYMKDGLYLLMPFRDSQDRLQMVDLTYIIPGIGDMREMNSRGIWPTVFQHPAITLPGDLARNRKYSGEPIYYDWQPWSIQASRTASHIWESLLPSWFGPWGTDWKRYTRALGEEPGAQTIDQAIAAQFGAKITPLDRRKILRTDETMRRIHETEMTTQMKKELRSAKTPEDKSEVLAKYRELRKEFMREYLDPRTPFEQKLESIFD